MEYKAEPNACALMTTGAPAGRTGRAIVINNKTIVKILRRWRDTNSNHLVPSELVAYGALSNRTLLFRTCPVILGVDIGIHNAARRFTLGMLMRLDYVVPICQYEKPHLGRANTWTGIL